MWDGRIENGLPARGYREISDIRRDFGYA